MDGMQLLLVPLLTHLDGTKGNTGALCNPLITMQRQNCLFRKFQTMGKACTVK